MEAFDVNEATRLFSYHAARKELAREIGIRSESFTYEAFEAYSSLGEEQRNLYKEIVSGLNAQKEAEISESLTEKIAVMALEKILVTPDATKLLNAIDTITKPYQFSSVPFSGYLGHKEDQLLIVEMVMENPAIGHCPDKIESRFKSLKKLTENLYISEKAASLRNEGVCGADIKKRLAESVREYFKLVGEVCSVRLFQYQQSRKTLAEQVGLRAESLTYVAFEACSRLSQEQKNQYKELVQDLNFLAESICIDKDTAEIIAVGALENTLKTNDALAYINAVKTMTDLKEFADIPFAFSSSNINDQFSIARSIVMGSGLLNYQPHSILAAFLGQKSAAAYLYLAEKRLRLRDCGIPENKIESKLKKMIAEYFSAGDFVISEGLKMIEVLEAERIS